MRCGCGACLDRLRLRPDALRQRTANGWHADHLKPLPARAGARYRAGGQLDRVPPQGGIFCNARLAESGAAGGSPVTGLEIVANQSRLPGLVLVEANVLARPTDVALVERYSRGDTEPLFFRPVRAGVAAYEQRLHAPLTHEQVALDLRRLVGQPPSDFDNRIYADRALQQFNAEDPTDAARTNAKRIAALIRAVEQRGARVLLFELPYSEPIEGSRSAATTREIIHAAFLDSNRWLPVEVNRSDLRWADGVHLDERSAVIVTQAMERALRRYRG